MLEHRSGDLNPKGPDHERIISQLETRILTTGAQLQAGGIDWWRALQMIDTLKERKLIKEWERARVYSGLASLQKDGLVCARWVFPESPEEITTREFQVTEDGNKARSKVPVTSDPKNLVPGSVSATEPI